MGWFRGRRQSADVVERQHSGPSFSIGDPALADWFGIGSANDAGVAVNEKTALGITAVYRAVNLISSTIAGLPLKTYRDLGDETRERVPSVFDNPGGTWLTPYEWKKLVATYGALHGAAPLLHVYNQGGALAALFPIHPRLVTVEWDADQLERTYRVEADGQVSTYTDADFTYIMFFTLDGVRACSPISLMRNALGTAMAGDKAAARMFGNGLLLSGVVTPDEELSDDEAEDLVAQLRAKLSGTRNAGDIAIINAALKFTPWSMNAEDAQFLQSRQYGVDEVARAWGIPKEMLSAAGATSWGSGIQELVRGFSRFTLPEYTRPIEARCSRLLSNPRFVEFEYAGLMAGTPDEEIRLLIEQVNAGLLTVDEARAIRNLPPLPAGGNEAPAPPDDEGNQSV